MVEAYTLEIEGGMTLTRQDTGNISEPWVGGHTLMSVALI